MSELTPDEVKITDFRLDFFSFMLRQKFVQMSRTAIKSKTGIILSILILI